AAQREATLGERAHIDEIVDQAIEEAHVAADARHCLRGIEAIARHAARIADLGLGRDRRKRVLQMVGALRGTGTDRLSSLDRYGHVTITPILHLRLYTVHFHGPVPSA